MLTEGQAMRKLKQAKQRRDDAEQAFKEAKAEAMPFIRPHLEQAKSWFHEVTGVMVKCVRRFTASTAIPPRAFNDAVTGVYTECTLRDGVDIEKLRSLLGDDFNKFFAQKRVVNLDSEKASTCWLALTEAQRDAVRKKIVVRETIQVSLR